MATRRLDLRTPIIPGADDGLPEALAGLVHGAVALAEVSGAVVAAGAVAGVDGGGKFFSLIFY